MEPFLSYRTEIPIIVMLRLLETLPVKRSSSIYGRGAGVIALSELSCDGTEANLIECSTPDVQSRICDHSEDAGVRCGGNGKIHT